MVNLHTTVSNHGYANVHIINQYYTTYQIYTL